MPGLIVAELSFQVIEGLRELMPRIKCGDRGLADQLMRAATSVALNIAEGNQSDAGNRRARFFTAAGSANESRAALRIAVAWGYVATADVERANLLLDRVVAILWKMTH